MLIIKVDINHNLYRRKALFSLERDKKGMNSVRRVAMGGDEDDDKCAVTVLSAGVEMSINGGGGVNIQNHW